MGNDELLLAIRQIVKEETEPIKHNISSMKDDILELKAGQDFLQQQVTKANIILENDIDKKLSALFDGHALNAEKIDHITETVDDIDALFTATDIVTHANTKEINKLKAKIG